MPVIKKQAKLLCGIINYRRCHRIGKPLLITRNPYHDDSYLNGARTVDTVEDWIKAIKEIIENTKSTTIENEVNMVTCYQKMKKEMGL